MKVRCIDGSWSNNELTTGKEYEVLSETIYHYFLRCNDKGRGYKGYTKIRFKIVKEDNMEKTFREVIATIKEGETWVNDIAPISYIRLREDGVLDFNENEGVNLFCTYTLQKKQGTFEEAFKAYEKGIKVESEYSGISYEKKNKSQVEVSCDNNTSLESEFNISFSTGEIREKWYINN